MNKKNKFSIKAKLSKDITIGILAYHGSVIEHKRMLEKLDCKVIDVRTKKDLALCDGLIIPGGESTSFIKAIKKEGLDREIIRRAKAKNKSVRSLAVYGTCAGAILLAKKVLDKKADTPKLGLLGLLDMTILRNSYGRQVDSFIAEINIHDFKQAKGVFIRAPVILSVAKNVDIISIYDDEIIMVKQDNILATTFHPEMTNDDCIHKYFLGIVKNLYKKKAIVR